MADDIYMDRELETAQWEQVQAKTFGKARRQIERVYEPPFYREKYDKAGVRPPDISTPEDLAKLPFFEKDEERESQRQSPPLGAHLCVDPTEVVRIQASSGTTGAPTFFAFTEADLRSCNGG